MRAHQAASSASSAREKCARPLVVGPSPVSTPSRTMVSARAAVLRQVGSGTPIASTLFSTLLDFADIVTVTLLSSVSFLWSRGSKRVVNDSKLESLNFDMVAD